MPFDNFDIVCIPSLLNEGFKEIIIKDLCYNILNLLKEKQTFGCLFEELLPLLSFEIKKDEYQVYRLVINELEYLFYHGLICVESN